MAVRAQIDIKGLEEYLERIQQAGLDVDQAAGRAVAAGGDVVLESMQEKVPVLTGNLEENLERTEPAQDGNFVYVEVGISKKADDETHRYGNAQEYGTSSMPAQPYIRPSFDENKRKVRAAEKAALEADGIVTS